MSKDNMSQYSGIAESYSQLPLSSLRELKSILEVEIEKRLEGFGKVLTTCYGDPAQSVTKQKPFLRVVKGGRE